MVDALDSKRSFFISYNRTNQNWAEWIGWQLEEAGYSVTIQAWDFRPGQNFALEMDRAARTAEQTLLVLSPNFLASRFTQPEWAAAFARDPTGEKRLLVPIRVAECDPRGLLSQTVYIDLVDLDESRAVEVLLAGLKPRGKPGTPPPFPPGTAILPEVRTIEKPAPFPGVQDEPAPVPVSLANAAGAPSPDPHAANMQELIEVTLDKEFRPLDARGFELALSILMEDIDLGHEIPLQILINGNEDVIREFMTSSSKSAVTTKERMRRQEIKIRMEELGYIFRYNREVNLLAETALGIKIIVREFWKSRQLLHNRQEVIYVVLEFLNIQAGRWPRYQHSNPNPHSTEFDLISPGGESTRIILDERETQNLIDSEGIELPWLTVGWGLRLHHLQRNIVVQRALPLIVREYLRLNWSGKELDNAGYFDVLNWRVGLA